MSDRHAPSPAPESGAPALGPDEIATARRYADASRAAGTRRAYGSDWRCFSRWCAARGLDPLPAHAGTVALFLAAQAAAGLAPPTLGRRLAAALAGRCSTSCARAQDR